MKLTQTYHCCVRKALLFNYLTFPNDERSISQNINPSNILIHDLTNLLFYEGSFFAETGPRTTEKSYERS